MIPEMDSRYGSVLDQIVERFKVSYCDRGYVESDLSALRNRLVAEVEGTDPLDDEDFAGIVASALEAVPMSHLAFWSRAQVGKIRQRSAQPPAAMRWSRHRTQFANYIRLPSLRVEAFDMADVIDTIGATGDQQTLVLDLRLNDGGSASSAGHLLGALTGPDVAFLRTGQNDGVASVVYPFTPQDNVDQAADVRVIERHSRTEWRTAHDARRWTQQPVVVLVGERTYSMGEVFAEAVVESGSGISVGSTTAGTVVAAQEFDCGHGFELLLPFATMSTPAGIDLEGRGHIPTVAHDFGASDLAPLDEQVVDDLVAELPAFRSN